MAAVEGGIREPPGLARQRRPRLRRSVAATGDMDGDGHGGGGGSRYVLALPAMASLAVLIAHLDAAVPRRPRSYLPRAVPMGWWAFRLPVFSRPPPSPPSPAKNPVKEEEEEEEEEARVLVVAPPPVDPGEEAGKRAAKRARRCLNCDAVETPQWRSGPMGKSTLCNACGVRLRAVGSLPEHRPAARTTPTEPPPTAPASPPDSPIWTPGHKPSSSPDIYLVRRTPKLPVTRPPRSKQPPPTAPAPVSPPPPPAPKTKTKTKAKKQKRKRSCVHCGSTETPQWREGPMGRGTLCNACGVRYRQGRLLPEYRPKGSPTFSPSVHAANHRQVLELRRQQRHNTNSAATTAAKPIPDEQKPVDLPAQEEVVNAPVAATGGAASSLDALLFDGPSAPLIVDGDDFLVS